MCIIAVVIISYGIASRSIAYYPNAEILSQTGFSTAFDSRSVLRQVVYPVYYLLYGEFGNELSNLDGKSTAR